MGSSGGSGAPVWVMRACRDETAPLRGPVPPKAMTSPGTDSPESGASRSVTFIGSDGAAGGLSPQPPHPEVITATSTKSTTQNVLPDFKRHLRPRLISRPRVDSTLRSGLLEFKTN